MSQTSSGFSQEGGVGRGQRGALRFYVYTSTVLEFDMKEVYF